MTRLTTLLITGAIAGLLTSGLRAEDVGVPTAALPQPPADHPHHPYHPQAGLQPDMREQDRQMTEMRQKMMAEMKAMDAKLEELANAMNTATGDAKVDAIAELLTTLVQQRTTMHERMMDMHQQMMGHMMQHMAAGMSPDAKKSMMECPMMKQMGGMKK